MLINYDMHTRASPTRPGRWGGGLYLQERPSVVSSIPIQHPAILVPTLNDEIAKTGGGPLHMISFLDIVRANITNGE